MKENAAIQVQLTDLFIHALQNEPIRHNGIKEAQSDYHWHRTGKKAWKKTRSSGTRVQLREGLGSRKNSGKKSPVLNRECGS